MKEILFILLQLVLQSRKKNRAEQINTVAILKARMNAGKKRKWMMMHKYSIQIEANSKQTVISVQFENQAFLLHTLLNT